MTPTDATLAVIVELRQHIAGLEAVNEKLTVDILAAQQDNARLHAEIDALHDQAGN